MRALPDPVLLAEAIRSGDRAVLARAITLVESTKPEHRAVARRLVQMLLPETGRAIRIGIAQAKAWAEHHGLPVHDTDAAG